MLRTQIDESINAEVPTIEQLQHKTDYLNEIEAIVAPDFLEADQILNEVPIWPLAINVFSACFCMGCSALYHLMFVKNRKVSEALARLDYGGISILIFGTSFPILYYAMACDQIYGKSR